MEDAEIASLHSSVSESSQLSVIPIDAAPQEIQQTPSTQSPQLHSKSPSPRRSATPPTQSAPIPPSPAPQLHSKSPSPRSSATPSTQSALIPPPPAPQLQSKSPSPRRSATPSTQSAPIPPPAAPQLSPRLSANPSTGQASPDMSTKDNKSLKSQSIKSNHLGSKIVDEVCSLKPEGNKSLHERIEDMKGTFKDLASDIVDCQSNSLTTNIDKIATMSKVLTNEANALRQSIKCLSEDIARTKQDLCYCGKDEDVNFPYHLFLIEIIINKIHMKCECFDIDYNNLVISAVFLGKQPIVLYDSSFGKIENFSKLNVGKSTLFAMTYDKICSIKEFEIVLLLTKQPPCSTCVTNIAETHIDYTSEFISLREELCKKWMEEQPTDNILCTTSTPLSKNMYYLSCCDGENRDSIGVIEVTIRMSFLGKEITTAFCASPKPQGTGSFLLKEDHGMAMYSCHKVEMDDQGKILLDEGVMSKKPKACTGDHHKRAESPHSQLSSAISRRSYEPVPYYDCCDRSPKYDEIYTKMNVNELRIRVPKSTRVERMGKYDKMQELCSCESTAYNTGEQIQFELPNDPTYPEKTYTSNLKYTLKGLERPPDRKDKKTINITPASCPVPVDMAKVLHPQKDVFILKIGKKLETKDKKTDLEIELVTPKAPNDKPLESNNIGQQYSCSDVMSTKSTGKKEKVKNKKSKGGKGKKTKKGKKK